MKSSRRTSTVTEPKKKKVSAKTEEVFGPLQSLPTTVLYYVAAHGSRALRVCIGLSPRLKNLRRLSMHGTGVFSVRS